jgi:hypothetical protein
VPPVPGEVVPPVPGEIEPPVPGEFVPPVPGEAVPPVPGEPAPPVPGEEPPVLDVEFPLPPLPVLDVFGATGSPPICPWQPRLAAAAASDRPRHHCRMKGRHMLREYRHAASIRPPRSMKACLPRSPRRYVTNSGVMAIPGSSGARLTRAAVLFASLVATGACHVTLNFSGPGCATDSDCPLASLHCDPFSRQCLPCVSDGNCASSPGGPRCDAVLHLCVQCGTDQDCAAGSKCISVTRSCVRTCAVDTDCATSGTSCEDGICAQCDEDQQCSGARPRCDPATFQCTGCVTDAECASAAAPLCDRSAGRCVQCLTVEDCADGMVCDPTDSTCKGVGA